MKSLLISTLLFLMSWTTIIAQKQTVTIDKINIDEKIFTGQIDNKYNITIYLKKHYKVDATEGVYTVKGWYYYNKHKKKIALVGLFDGDLTLFKLKTKAEEDKVLNFELSEGYFWDGMEAIKNLAVFEEKFVYTQEAKVRQWSSGTKKLPLQLYADDLSVAKELEVLRIKTGTSEKHIELDHLGIYAPDSKIVAHRHHASGTRILLSFEYISNPMNKQGRCGGGLEMGYILLVYDAAFNLVDLQQVVTESCYDDIYTLEGKDLGNGVMRYEVQQREKQPKLLTIDRKKVEMVVKEK